MTFAILAASLLLLIGFALRAGVKPIRRLHVPSSVIAGLVGLLLIQLTLWRTGGSPPAWMADIVAQFRAWPTPLIAVVFAGILMEKPRKSHDARPRDVVRQGIAAWIVILGQVLLGVLVTWLWIRPAYGVPGTFGQLIEVGMAGGPGTARAMGDVYTKQFAFPEGVDLGLFVATFGLVWGVFSGIALVNIGYRRGWPTLRDAQRGPEFVSGIEPELTGASIGSARVRADVLDPLLLQVLLLAAAFGLGVMMQAGLERIVALFAPFDFSPMLKHASTAVGFTAPPRPRHWSDFVGNIPLFLFTLLAGLIIRETLFRLGLYRLLDAPTLQRLTGVALEFVIVASLSAISLSALQTYFLPVAVLLLLGCAWCVFNLVWVSPRLLPRRCWFELGLMNYGFATATTPQSILLLKMVDRDLKTGAAEIYAAAVPLSAPFIGGGVLTLVGFPLLIAQVGEWSVVLLCAIAITVLWISGRRLARAESSAADV